MPVPLTIDSVPAHKSLIDLSSFPKNTFNSVLYGFKLKQILDDVLLAKYVDETSDGSAIMRRGILIPGNSDTKAWRIGKVLLAGPTVKYVKVGDHIIFPNNLGVPIANIELEEYGTLTKGIFINEQRIFGICSQIDDNESIASIVNNATTT
jgi:cellobiose-specific phosphotransferase system component IIB